MNLLPIPLYPRHTTNCASSWHPISMPVEFLLAAGYGLSLAGTGAGNQVAGSKRAFDGSNHQRGLRKEIERRSGRYRYKNAVPAPA